jgi:hypothetical protein
LSLVPVEPVDEPEKLDLPGLVAEPEGDLLFRRHDLRPFERRVGPVIVLEAFPAFPAVFLGREFLPDDLHGIRQVPVPEVFVGGQEPVQGLDDAVPDRPVDLLDLMDAASIYASMVSLPPSVDVLEPVAETAVVEGPDAADGINGSHGASPCASRYREGNP